VPSHKSSRRADPFARPLDATLERLRVHGIPYRGDYSDIDRWLTSCPVCAEELLLHEPYLGAPVTVRCASQCHESRIVAALAAEPHSQDAGLDLAEGVSEIAHRALDLLEERCR
jgi:hypothetical protein